jgi:hypothetical protein
VGSLETIIVSGLVLLYFVLTFIGVDDVIDIVTLYGDLTGR